MAQVHPHLLPFGHFFPHGGGEKGEVLRGGGGEVVGLRIRQLRFRQTPICFKAVTSRRKEHCKFLVGRQGFEVLSTGDLGGRKGHRPGVVILVRETVQALAGGLDVQALVAVRAFPPGEDVGLAGDQLERITELASDRDVKHRHGNAGALMFSGQEAMQEQVS